jgi:hypothetical protein
LHLELAATATGENCRRSRSEGITGQEVWLLTYHCDCLRSKWEMVKEEKLGEVVAVGLVSRSLLSHWALPNLKIPTGLGLGRATAEAQNFV